MGLTRTDLSYNTFGPADLMRVDYVDWSLRVNDPHEAAPEEVGELTKTAVTELADSLGCKFQHCVDYDSDGGTPYYRWSVLVPQAEHRSQDPDGVPTAVNRIHQLLRGMLPGLDSWHVSPDRDWTRRRAIGELMKETYCDLVTALDEEFLAARTGGAEDLEPSAQLWHEDERTMVGSYAIWLGHDPAYDPPHTWLVLTAGTWPETDADQMGPPWSTYDRPDPNKRELDRFNVGDSAPVLLLPRPTWPIFTAKVTTGATPGRGTIFSSDAKAVGGTHQWNARDPRVLAANIRRDLDLLFPGFLKHS
ncbi:hypothetical protein [Streptacidiphilus sp. EB103A]|uniref:hypothetical protein n=1 Tax=Streptacidiphilus sp. EB103A TaxID=3156275 RepID=UPI003518AFCD